MAIVLRAGDPCAPIGLHTRGFFEQWFPTPSFIAYHGTGVDISDTSVKAIQFAPYKSGWKIDKMASQSLKPGIVVEGAIKNVDELAAALKLLSQAAGGITHAHVALPEEEAFVFSMEVPDARDRLQVTNMIEFELEGRVPLKPDQTVFDYDIVTIHADGASAEIGVSVFPVEVVQQYVAAFQKAGIVLMSLELEARSIARAILPPTSREVVLVADFGRARTGIAVIKGQIPIFTHTVQVGGDGMSAVIMKELNVNEAELDKLKNEKGIVRTGDDKVTGAMVGTASALADEISRHYSYWDTRRNEHDERVTPLAKVLLAGGSANLKGLPEYIATRVQAATLRADVWVNVCSFDEYIPPITKTNSLGFATAIGLALRSI
jgi:type IV pilus assembly protein PilM